MQLFGSVIAATSLPSKAGFPPSSPSLCDAAGSAPAQENEIEELDDEWDFDNGGIILETKDDEARRHWPYIRFLGFHPYKEIALFSSSERVLSYQLNTSKVKELGVL